MHIAGFCQFVQVVEHGIGNKGKLLHTTCGAVPAIDCMQHAVVGAKIKNRRLGLGTIDQLLALHISGVIGCRTGRDRFQDAAVTEAGHARNSRSRVENVANPRTALPVGTISGTQASGCTGLVAGIALQKRYQLINGVQRWIQRAQQARFHRRIQTRRGKRNTIKPASNGGCGVHIACTSSGHFGAGTPCNRTCVVVSAVGLQSKCLYIT